MTRCPQRGSTPEPGSNGWGEKSRGGHVSRLPTTHFYFLVSCTANGDRAVIAHDDGLVGLTGVHRTQNSS